jgi:glycosyltransferase involved in cell wall biosynthesis
MLAKHHLRYLIEHVLKHLKKLYFALFGAIAHPALRRRRGNTFELPASPNIKIVSYYGKHNGISHGAHLQGVAYRALGFQVDLIDVTRAMINPLVKVACSKGDLFIFHCDGSDFMRAAWPIRRQIHHGKVVGYFAWELAEPPRGWPKWEDSWDEIWTPSKFSAQSLVKYYECPIKVVPHVLLNRDAKPRRWRKGEEPLVFLTMADIRASLDRKNPRGTIAAFQRAFPNERDVTLVVKLNGVRSTSNIERLLVEIGSDSRIQVISQTLNRPDVDQLFRDAHVFVSLHRAEGFGLPLMEAQGRGLATIATAWSGNLDFTTPKTSILIPYQLVTMQDKGGVYGTVTWADPDIGAAAKAMRTFYDDPGELARVANAGWEDSRPEIQLARFAEALA